MVALTKEADMVKVSKLIHVAPNLKVTLNMVTWKDKLSINMILVTCMWVKCIADLEKGMEV